MSVLRGFLGVCVCCWLLTADAHATQRVALSVSLSPKKLGASTTIDFGFRITAPKGEIPSPLVNLDLHLPEGMNTATSTLGLASCSSNTLIQYGLEACPANSIAGHGTGFVEVPFVSQAIVEPMTLTALFGPSQDGELVLLFLARGVLPIAAELVFPGLLLPDTAPFSAQLDTALPLVPSVPEGPDVAVIRFRSSIGPRGLLYSRMVHGRSVPYHPRGINVPSKCPAGGFPFAADFEFQDGTTVRAATRVRCPRSLGGARGG